MIPRFDESRSIESALPLPPRTIGRTNIQDYPSTQDYLIENQSVAPSSICESNILDEKNESFKLINFSQDASSQQILPYKMPFMRKFVFKIPPIIVSDQERKVVRTKMTFNIRNFMKSPFGSDENKGNINFSSSDVLEIKKGSKHAFFGSLDHTESLPSDDVVKTESEDEKPDLPEINKQLSQTSEEEKSPDLQTFDFQGRQKIEDNLQELSEENNVKYEFPKSVESFEAADYAPQSPVYFLTDDSESSDKIDRERYEREYSTDVSQMPYEDYSKESPDLESFEINQAPKSLAELENAIAKSMQIIESTPYKLKSPVSEESASVGTEPKSNLPVALPTAVSKKLIKPHRRHHHTAKENYKDSSDEDESTVAKSVIEVAKIWKRLKDNIIAARQNPSKSNDDGLSEIELANTFVELVKKIVGLPSEMKRKLHDDARKEDTGSGYNGSTQTFHTQESSIMNIDDTNYGRFLEHDPVSSTVRNLKEVLPNSVILTDTQLKYLSKNIVDNLRRCMEKRSSNLQKIGSDSSTRSARIEKSLQEVKEHLKDMKDRLQDITESEVIVTHEQMVDNSDVPIQIVQRNLNDVHQLVEMLERRAESDQTEQARLNETFRNIRNQNIEPE